MELGSQPADLVENLEGWAGSILRVRRESRETADSCPDYWGPFDLVGMYHQRERLDAELADARPGSRVLEALDELLLTICEEVGTSWVSAIGLGDELGSGWWWGFVPASGPLRSELEERRDG